MCVMQEKTVLEAHKLMDLAIPTSRFLVIEATSLRIIIVV